MVLLAWKCVKLPKGIIAQLVEHWIEGPAAQVRFLVIPQTLNNSNMKKHNSEQITEWLASKGDKPKTITIYKL